ncbi:MAG TPA: hypothetical protein VF137_02185 [Candidatus Dormibacteraeota bacterium]
MARGLVGLAIAVVLVGCSSAGGAAARRGVVIPRPASPVVAAPAPAGAILTIADVGLPLVVAADDVPAQLAANEVPDAADALRLYESWGWIDESTRHFAGGGAAVDVTVLETLRASGAQAAFAFWSARLSGSCPATVAPVDECALGQSGAGSMVVARLGAAVFEITAAGADASHLAALQARRLAL